ncbi:MAG TPA: hypothetical protein VJB70_04270 [Candidatus Paceibacterota bacterium]
MALRIIAQFIMLFSLLFLPWWVTALCGIVFLFFITSFYEIIFWGFLGDVLYGTQITSLYNFSYLMTVGALVLFVLMQYAKKEMRLYEL